MPPEHSPSSLRCGFSWASRTAAVQHFLLTMATCLLWAISPAVAAAELRTGLVLSGGGARGAAHVGVLRELEAAHVRIDAIAGTSMGAVVGGLYASGVPLDDIEKLFRSTDWEEAFRDRAPRSDLGFRRKQDDREFLVRVPLGVRGTQLVLPQGLVQGQKLLATLRRMTLPVSHITEFDQLPIPFRAMATDIVSGEGVALSRGDLAQSLRASLSAPAVFAPVELDGRLLVDGGLAANLPVDLARQMGVDRLIVVDVSFPLVPRVRVVGVAPGLTLTSDQIDPAQLARLQAATPLGHGVHPDDIAEAVAYLLRARSVTGHVLVVDAGSHLAPAARDFAFQSA